MNKEFQILESVETLDDLSLDMIIGGANDKFQEAEECSFCNTCGTSNNSNNGDKKLVVSMG